MTARIREWYEARSQREQRLLLAMIAIALPLLAWLLVVRPLNNAYDDALQAQLEAVDRHGRVLALADTAKSKSVSGPHPSAGADLQLVVTESASQTGIALQGATPAGLDSIDVTIAGTSAPAVGQWLQGLEAHGVSVQELRMTPQGQAVVSMSARLARRA
jgi:general secretion pathway protein M